MTFEIRHLRFALAAADHGSFYKAARALSIEQSTLSRGILKLEHILGAKLFDRTRAGVTTTTAGERFIRSARPMVAYADRMIARTRAAGQGRAGALTIGYNSSVSAGNLRATMQGWRDAHPDVELNGIEADRSALLAGLDTGEIDIAILMGEAALNGYRREPFWSERMLVALPSNHSLAEREIVHWTDLRGERILLTAADPGSEIRDMVLGRLAVSGVTPDIRIHHASRETILSTLGGGLGVSVICEGTTGARYPDVVYRPIHGEQGPALIVYSGYWLSNNDNPAFKIFLAFVRNRFALSFNLNELVEENGSSLSGGQPS